MASVTPISPDKNQVTKITTNPRISGPGIWFTFHLLGAKADTPEKIDRYIDYVNTIIRHHPCPVCRDHALKYLKGRPIENYRGMKDQRGGKMIGMFTWSWEYHNHVNEKLNKPTIEWPDAYQLYAESMVCQSSQTETPQTNSPSIIGHSNQKVEHPPDTKSKNPWENILRFSATKIL